ncbi:Uncharacterised protein [uncultured archaeon]|nr:Uncharacterised protein [uncultured archaeon]
MSVKPFLRDFVIHRDAPAFLSGVAAVITLFNIYGVIAIGIFLVIWFIRLLLDHNLSLIKEYKSLMFPLERLVLTNRTTSIWLVIMNDLQNKNLRRCWVYYFNEKGEVLEKRFHDLNNELNKLIYNPYLLRKSKTSSITRKFNSLVNDYDRQYRIFIEMIDTENISKNSFNYGMIKKANEDFYSALNQSGNKFAEIRSEFQNNFFLPLPEPKQ